MHSSHLQMEEGRGVADSEELQQLDLVEIGIGEVQHHNGVVRCL